MVQNVNPTFVKTPNAAVVSISTGNTQNQTITVYVGAASGSKISGLNAAAINTTAAFDVRFAVSTGSALYYLGTVTVPVNSGITSGVPSVNMFSPLVSPGLTIDSDGNPFILLPSSAWSLVINSPATSSQWTASASILVSAPSIGDF